VSISSPPKVTFAVSDGAKTNNPIVGLGASTQGSTATRPSLTYLRFALAKLVPGTNGSPSKWVNYIVTTVPTYKSATDKTIVPAAPRTPTADREGELVDNKNGTYTYTFYRDVTKAKEIVDGATLTAPNVAADLGDLTYEPKLTHRLAIQLSGVGTPMNAIYDFIPETRKAVAATDTQRNVVAVESCNECHQTLTLHGSRVETKFCVVCHTDQLKYGSANTASSNLVFNAATFKEKATVNATTGITSYTYEPPMMVADGEVLGNFPVLVHKIHNGAALIKQNYNFANVAFNNKGFSMLDKGQRMCSKCHDSTKAAQADNWNTVPSKLACGACHDGINFTDGTGTTLAGLTTGHVGKSQSSDLACALCHAPADIKKYHQTNNVTKHNPTIPTGLSTFAYDVKSADVDATTNNLTVKFKITKDGTPLTTVATPPAGHTGAPGFILAWAEAQDGITVPVDYNNKGRAQAQAKTATIAAATGPDSTGYFTLVIPSASAFPVGAKMRAVALQSYYTTTAGVGRHALSSVKAVTGDTARREVVSATKCSNCHEWFEGHGGQRNIGPESSTMVCVLCHVPGLASSGRGATAAQLKAYAWATSDKKKLADWGIDWTTFGNGADDALKYPVVTNNFKDLIHGIHSGRERVTPFNDARNRTGTQTLLDFKRMDFPGVLKNCETCHIAGTYANVSQFALASTFEHINTAYATTKTQVNALASISATTANDTDVVTSPFAAACVSCHDSAAAQGHVATQGGLIKGTRAAFAAKIATPGQGEACAICHGAGRAEDITVKHK
jgi:OmcA/MtrC family decaheme c-type cytochrome